MSLLIALLLCLGVDMQQNPFLQNLQSGYNPAMLNYALQNDFVRWGADEDGNPQLMQGGAASSYGEGWENAVAGQYQSATFPDQIDVGGVPYSYTPGSTPDTPMANPADLIGKESTITPGQAAASASNALNTTVPAVAGPNGGAYIPTSAANQIAAIDNSSGDFVQKALNNGAGVAALAAPIASGGLLGIGPLAGVGGAPVFDVPGMLADLLAQTPSIGNAPGIGEGSIIPADAEGLNLPGGDFNVTPETVDLPYTDSTVTPTETTIPPGQTGFPDINLPPVPPVPPTTPEGGGPNYGDNIDAEQMETPGGVNAPPVGNGPVTTINGMAVPSGTIPGFPNSTPGSIAQGALQAGLGAYGAKEQADALKDMQNQWLALGAPSRARYEASFQPGFSIYDADPAAKDAATQAASISARGYAATGGNPFDNPASQAGIYAATIPVGMNQLNTYRSQNLTGGQLGVNTAGTAGLAGAENAGATANAIGYGLGTALNGSTDYSKLFQQYGLGQPTYTLRQ